MQSDFLGISRSEVSFSMVGLLNRTQNRLRNIYETDLSTKKRLEANRNRPVRITVTGPAWCDKLR